MSAYCFTMYGQFGAALDPSGGQAVLTQKIAALGVNVGSSPYQWTDTQIIADAMKALPADSMVFLEGDSLGASSVLLVASAFNGTRKIDCCFGIQPSVYGQDVPITPNLDYAVCFYDPNWIETLGLGARQWELAAGNTITKLSNVPFNHAHPGDDDPTIQTLVLNEIKAILNG
jgi:hypothetical protein